MTDYPMEASRELVAALCRPDGDPRFDEYTIVGNRDRLPVGFLRSRRQSTRVAAYRWLLWAAEQGLIDRDPRTGWCYPPTTDARRAGVDRDGARVLSAASGRRGPLRPGRSQLITRDTCYDCITKP